LSFAKDWEVCGIESLQHIIQEFREVNEVSLCTPVLYIPSPKLKSHKEMKLGDFICYFLSKFARIN